MTPPRRDLPTGTVSFLFTDVEGSTKLLLELGAEEYAQALAEHRRILRQAFGAAGGVEVDTQGDAFFVAFSTAPGALRAASEASQGLGLGPIRVRMGVHTGTPHITEEGYVGVDVHRAARIAACGHGGQVLVSAATAALVGPDGLRDLGEHRLKDLSAPERIYQVGDADFPRLKTLHQTNLPIPATPFLGREHELGEITELLGREGLRLLTLTGPGGSGKTRLALQAAGAVSDTYREGVWWVQLAPLRDAASVVATAARALGASGDLAEHVSDKRMLLLLDNFEHVIDAAPDVGTLIALCPHLDVLVTSRAPLRLYGESVYAVDPLRKDEAVELFVQRARAVRRDFETDGVVGEICDRLDHLPLAVELAATRVKVLGTRDLLERLERRLPVLVGRTRDAPERQRTLRATIEWSHGLLVPEEQRLFSRLAVFAGGFTLPAADAVCDAELETLEALVEHSLVRRGERGRLGMLDTIREYAEELLDRSEEREAIRRHHAEHYLHVAESANLSVEALGRGPQRHDIVIPEQHNLRSAIDWATETDIELGLRLAVALENFWVTQDPTEGVRRFEALLARAEDVEPILRARALRDYGGCADMAGDYDRAEPAYARSGELFREAGDESGAATAVFRLGVIASRVGDYERGRRLWEESLETFRRIADPIGELQTIGNLGWLELEHGDPERGSELVEMSLAMAREVGWVWWEAQALEELAEQALEAGGIVEGEQRARESLKLSHEIGDRSGTIRGLAIVAWAAAEQGDAQRAVALWAVIEAEEARGPIAQWTSEREKYAAHMPQVAGPAVALPLDDAMNLALGVDPPV